MRIQFVGELPPRGSDTKRGRPWVKRLGKLHTRPNEWAIVFRSKSRGTAGAIATFLKQGKFHMPAGRFEFATRDCNVYARWIGPGKGNWKNGHANGRGKRG